MGLFYTACSGFRCATVCAGYSGYGVFRSYVKPLNFRPRRWAAVRFTADCVRPTTATGFALTVLATRAMAGVGGCKVGGLCGCFRRRGRNGCFTSFGANFCYCGAARFYLTSRSGATFSGWQLFLLRFNIVF